MSFLSYYTHAFERLETFNAVILHHLSENQNLIYGLLTAHKSFEDLGTFTLARGLREIKRIQLAKEEQLKKMEGILKSNRNNSGDAPGEDGDPHYEKARLLENEGVTPSRRSDSTDSVSEHSRPLRHTLSQGRDTPPSLGSSAAGSPMTTADVSEKSRGKMKERRSISLDTTGSLDLTAAAGVGRNGFVPTQEWVRSHSNYLLETAYNDLIPTCRSRHGNRGRFSPVSSQNFLPLSILMASLPLDNIMLLISELLPKVQELQAGRHKTNSVAAITDYLGSVTLKHVLPPAPSLTPRKFLVSQNLSAV